MKTRESNFELLRIIAILMIIFYHFLYHTGICSNSHGNLYLISNLIMGLIIIHVNLFILISGYFGYKNKFKISKLLSLNNSIWFYTVVILFIGILFLNASYTKLTILKAVLPISFNDYWFMTNFLLLYIFSPLLNRFINNSNKKTHLTVLIILLIVLSFLPTFTNMEFFNVDRGFSLYHFIFMYLLGAFLGKYKVSFKTSKLIIAYFGFFVLNCVFYVIGKNIADSPNLLLNYIGSIFSGSFIWYCNPIIIFQAIAFFLIFSNISINSKVINYIASCVLGIYLIHDNSIIRAFYQNKFIYSDKLDILLVGICFTILVFIVCLLIESIRKKLFKFIYNLKICKKIRPKYTKCFKRIENAINE